MTVDTANRLGLSTLQSFAHVPHKIWLCPRTSGCLKTGWSKHGLSTGPSESLSVPIHSYRSSTSASTACPESPRCPTKPEPIMTCGCAGKPWVLKISIRLFEPGWSFPQDVMAVSSIPGHPLVSPGSRSTVLHPELHCVRGLENLVLTGLDYLINLASLVLCTQPKSRLLKHSNMKFVVPGQVTALLGAYHMILQYVTIISKYLVSMQLGIGW